MRFGFEYRQAGWAAQSRSILMMDLNETTAHIVRDLHEVSVSSCTSSYEKKSAQNQAKKALEAIHD
ncbi:hypothetical protein [Candidatus Methylacidithermus pantelleriae]|uniref:Integrase n=1 Tax=Candidatus Methylacidithermus pantelleriae TaxID=2744239 RepID=A0A8J2FSV8_9BACT|nr:hypothetical protein [Candidatus Methylacidithermus pantelleriae]CAF0700975.1 hypothetical protein MPNT_40095 [Candidatus Methylacidithermus pantelleriae]